MPEIERPLTGGNSSLGVVRSGDSVRKPWRKSTPAVVEFMRAVRAAGVDAPEVLGRDDQGRQVIEFVDGELAMNLNHPLALDELARVGAMVRAIHDASEGFVPDVGAHWENPIPSPGSDLICHGDLAPWNLIVGERWVFIDWDGSSPSTRLWDLAYAASAFTLNDPQCPPAKAAERLAAFVAGYRADEGMRADLPAVMTARVAAMYELLRSSNTDGIEPWATMYLNGHGEHWLAVLQYVQTNERIWERAMRRSPLTGQ